MSSTTSRLSRPAQLNGSKGGAFSSLTILNLTVNVKIAMLYVNHIRTRLVI